MTKATKETSAAVAKRAGWMKRVGEWERSSQTQRVFCVERGLSFASFQWWRRRLARSDAAKVKVPFLPIALGADRSAGGAVIEIELRSRTRVRLEGEAALRAVDRLVSRIR